MRSRLATGALALLLLVGCSDSDDAASGKRKRPATRSTTTKVASDSYPVAYALPISVAQRLDTGDAYEVLNQQGRVVARSEWKPYAGVVLLEWLEDRGIRVYRTPNRLRRVVNSLNKEQDLQVLVLGQRHRRVLARLRHLTPSRASLTGYYERFTEERSPQGGTAMLDWLRVLRSSVQAVHPGTVVIVPLSD